MEEESTIFPLPLLVKPATAPKLSHNSVPTESCPLALLTLKVVDSLVPCRPRRMALLLPEATAIVLVTAPPAVTVPPKPKAWALPKPPFSETVPPFRVKSRMELKKPSEVIVPPALMVIAGVFVVVAAPQLSDPAMPKVPPLLTTMVLPTLLP